MSAHMLPLVFNDDQLALFLATRAPATKTMFVIALLILVWLSGQD